MRKTVFVAAVLLSLGAGCATATPAPLSDARGVSFSPRSYDAAGMTEFLAKAKEAGTVLSWAGAWSDLSKSPSPAAGVMGMAERQGMIPVIVTGYADGKGRLVGPLDDATIDRLAAEAGAFAKTNRPPYLALGNEVNAIADASPAAFDAFTRLFAGAAKAVKAASPATKVLVVFQLEGMKGLHGGLFGGKDDPSKARWDLVDRFPDADIVAFTTYPGLVFKDPKDIPDDYYSDIAAYVTKPVAFTEVGWQADTVAVGWESDAAEQAAFATRFRDRTADTHPIFAIWPFLYDQAIQEPFAHMGLIDDQGNARPAFGAWKR